MKFKLKQPTLGILAPNDLSFFYYDVAQWSEAELYEFENDAFINVAREIGIALIPIETKTFRQCDLCDNKLHFTFKRRTGKQDMTLSYQSAFFRHLRNSFAHYRITNLGDYFIIEDKIGDRYTCKGKILRNKLIKLITKIKQYDETIIR